jgi:hypothetical protein
MPKFVEGEPVDSVQIDIPAARSESCSNLYTAAYTDVPHLQSIGGGRGDQIHPIGNGFPNYDMGLIAPADSSPYMFPNKMCPGGGMPIHEVELGNWKDGGRLKSLGGGGELFPENIEKKSWMKRNLGFEF